MAINHLQRAEIVRVLKEAAYHDRAAILKALYDIRYNTGDGDEEILFPLFDHPDAGVVASALFTLWHSYDVRSTLEPMIRRFAQGDDRDEMDMLIQTMAIALLAEIAKSDSMALEQLKSLAEDIKTHYMPRLEAWQCLAEHYGVEWLSDFTEEMIMRPESEECEEIREKIRRAMR